MSQFSQLTKLTKLATILSVGSVTIALAQPVQSQNQLEKTESAEIATNKPSMANAPSIITTLDLQNRKVQIPWGKVVIIRDPFDGDVTKVFERQVVSTSKNTNPEVNAEDNVMGAPMLSSENVLVTEWSPTLVKAYVLVSSSTCMPQIAMPNNVNSGGSPLDAIGSLSSLTSMASMIPGAESIGMIGGALDMFSGIVGSVATPEPPSPKISCQTSTSEFQVPTQDLELKVGSKVFKLTKNKEGFALPPEISQELRTAQPKSVFVRATLNSEVKDMASVASGNTGMALNSPVIAEVSPNTVTAWRTIYSNPKSNPK
ncbi:hypothetical protein H6F42_20930 [Pseudanabaena sp. FACHB-1998]|uniref:hypothetical protein n=1 Tax=Pseudanabaena sp. FACHB-1998 TaxID=2692858 RepID=UPI0016809DA5|nr:hypothetical protein [Pseudanabaena sp. FACHB-1998]MBD2179388.1 hypothetical protein [Pseudanabaena sp. FACHB-1998]